MSIPPNGRRVKPPRRYDSTRRRAQAAQTHLDILKAAQQLFLEGGYASTTINSVAAAAGVAGGDLYRGVGGEGGLVKQGGGGARGRGGGPGRTAPAGRPL